MSEIKSTLDLVMEKTRHLTTSPEERTASAKSDIGRRIDGIKLKFDNSGHDSGVITKSLNDLMQQYPQFDEWYFIQELLSRIDLTENGLALTRACRELFHLKLDKMEFIHKEFKEKKSSEFDLHSKRIKQNWKAQYRISGEAIVPNLKKDVTWNAVLDNLKETFQSQLESAVCEQAASTGKAFRSVQS
jgi:hypothetical protein